MPGDGSAAIAAEIQLPCKRSSTRCKWGLLLSNDYNYNNDWWRLYSKRLGKNSKWSLHRPDCGYYFRFWNNNNYL